MVTLISNAADGSRADVGTACAAHGRARPLWHLINSLMAGTHEMRHHRELYLPMNPAETMRSYERRLLKTFLYEGFNLALETLVSKPFSADVALSKEVKDGPLAEFMNNIDGQGNDITTFAKHVCEVGLAKGLVHVLVDYPAVSNPGGITLAQKKAMNIRPYSVVIDPERIIGWRYDLLGTIPVLSQVRIEEVVCVPQGQWAEVEMRQIRVFERVSVDGAPMVSYSVYREIPDANETKKWEIVQQGYCSTDVIPLVTMYFGKRTGFFTAHPPLKGCAYLNLEHWQSSSEQRNILNVARCPIWFFAGYDETLDDEDSDGASASRVTMSPDSMIRATAPDAKLSIVEHSGAAIGSGRQDLLDIEARMAYSSVDMLAKKNSASSATQSTHDNEGEDCKLAAMVRVEEDGLATVLGLMYQYEGVKPPPGTSDKLLTINTAFGLEAQDAADLQTLYNSRMIGAISHATYLTELKRRGVLASNVNIEEEMATAAKDGPVAVPGKDNTSMQSGSPAGGGTQLSPKAGAGA